MWANSRMHEDYERLKDEVKVLKDVAKKVVNSPGNLRTLDYGLPNERFVYLIECHPKDWSDLRKLLGEKNIEINETLTS